MLDQCWANVADVGPTLIQNWADAFAENTSILAGGVGCYYALERSPGEDAASSVFLMVSDVTSIVVYMVKTAANQLLLLSSEYIV